MPGLTICLGCGTPIGEGQRPPTKAMLDHVASCPKHPLAKRIAELKHAIKEYGEHTSYCATREDDEALCSCGYAAYVED